MHRRHQRLVQSRPEPEGPANGPPPASPAPRSCKTCTHRRTVVTLFDTGQMREMLDCEQMVWPSPVTPESFYKHPALFIQRAADCPHFRNGRKPDLVINEISETCP